MIRGVATHLRGNAGGCPALFVALGGTAMASGMVVPANSVGTKQLKDGAVTGEKVAHDTLTGANINASTLGTLPNAAELGRRAPSAYQSAITQNCDGQGAL